MDAREQAIAVINAEDKEQYELRRRSEITHLLYGWDRDRYTLEQMIEHIKSLMWFERLRGEIKVGALNGKS